MRTISITQIIIVVTVIFLIFGDVKFLTKKLKKTLNRVTNLVKKKN